MISTAIWQDENFKKLSYQTRLLFIGLLTHADDYGFLIADPSYIRSSIFMYDDVPLKKVSAMLSEIVTNFPSVHLYSVGGNDYLHFAKWSTYQTLRSDRLVDSKYPACQTCGCHGVNQKSAESQHKLSKDKLS
jgi:hypothetical protein